MSAAYPIETDLVRVYLLQEQDGSWYALRQIFCAGPDGQYTHCAHNAAMGPLSDTEIDHVKADPLGWDGDWELGMRMRTVLDVAGMLGLAVIPLGTFPVPL